MASTKLAPIKLLAFMEASVVNGAAKSLLNFCDTLKRDPDSRVEVTIATFHRGSVQNGVAPNEFVEAVQSRGIKAIVIPERHRFDRDLVAALRKSGAEVNPDIVQTNNVKSHLLVRMSGLNRGRSWIAFHHGYTATDLKVKLYNQLDRWSLRAADRVVTVCGPFRQQLIAAQIPQARIRVVHNSAAISDSIPVEAANQIRRNLGLGQNTNVLIAIGRLSFEKGHADLIGALDQLRRSRPNLAWKLLMVGSGPEQANLETAVRQFGLEAQVIFTGQQSDVLPFLQISDLMVLPSHSEGSPHVVFEAMSAGVPILATRVGGIPEILTDGQTAVLVPPKNPEAMASGIARLLESPETALSLASRAREILVERFSHDTYKTTLLRIYDEVLHP
ncbi:MAG: glycosyltransferase family 4 protein [Acidobacteriota bacterium]|nr:glycosyltransferase family 4 protein [Acidobacteriota bacterium]